MGLGDRLHHLGRRRDVADLPAGDAEALARRADARGALAHARQGHDRQMPAVVEDDVLVDLVADGVGIVLAAQVRDEFEFLAIEHLRAGIHRRVEQDQLGAIAEGVAAAPGAAGSTTAAPAAPVSECRRPGARSAGMNRRAARSARPRRPARSGRTGNRPAPRSPPRSPAPRSASRSPVPGSAVRARPPPGAIRACPSSADTGCGRPSDSRPPRGAPPPVPCRRESPGRG